MNNEWVVEERQSENAHRHPPTPKRLRLEALSAPGLGKETPSFLPLLLRTVREKGNASGCYWIPLRMGTVLWWQWDLKQKNASELVGSGTGVRMSKGLKTITMTTITVLLLLCIELHFLYFVIFFKWQKFFLFETRYYVSQVDLKLVMQLRVTLNFWSFCFHLLVLPLEACSTVLVCVVAEDKSRALCLLANRITNWTLSQALRKIF